MAEQKRVLVVSFGALPAPTGRARRMAAALDVWGSRLQVDALTAKVEGEPHIERFSGARLMRVPMAGALPARAQTFERALRRQLASEEYELVLLGDCYAVSPVIKRRAQTPFKLVIDGSELLHQLWPQVAAELETEPRVRHRLLRLERHALAQADLVLSGSATQDELLTELGVRPDRLRRIWPSVALGAFPDLGSPSSETFILAALGRGASWEGLEIGVQAVALARQQGVAARLSVAGPLPPAHRQRLRDLAESLEAGEALELRGEVPENRVGEFLGSAHASLCLMRVPGQPQLPLGGQRLVEGLAAGRPVIAADTLPLRELAGDAALYLTSDDPLELARMIVELARAPAEAQALGQRGRARTRERFDAALGKQAWLTLVRELLDPGGAGLLEPSGPALLLPDADSPTLSFEQTRHGQEPTSGAFGEREDTRPLPPEPRQDEPTHVGGTPRPRGADWHRPRLPNEETPTPIKTI